MDLFDSNVWLALALSGHAHHGAARERLDGVDAAGAVLFCRATQQSLVRLLTHTSVLAAYGNPPLTNERAWEVYDAFMADERIAFCAADPTGLEAQWKAFALRNTASPKLWMDAYLAAFAVAAGYRMVTTDSAYRQFAGLELRLLV